MPVITQHTNIVHPPPPWNRDSETPERDIPTVSADEFNISPLEHGPGQNAFGTPDRPRQTNEDSAASDLLPSGDDDHSGTASDLGEPGPAIEDDDEIQTVRDILEKRPASRSPDDQKDAKKAKEGAA